MVRATANGKNGHGAEFAVSLAGRCISLTSRRGDLVLDPFVGSGTSALAAMELGRRCVGFDTGQTYIDTAQKRIKLLASRVGVQAKLVEVPVRHVDPASANGKRGLNGHSQGESLPIDGLKPLA